MNSTDPSSTDSPARVQTSAAGTPATNEWLRYASGWAALLAVLVAIWIVPYRVHSEGSYYTCGLIGDEYTYVQRIQPLMPGTTATNPVNGIADPAVRSEYYLEDVLRSVVTLLHVDAITFAWAWHALLPVSIALLLLLLAWYCVGRGTGGSLALALAASAAALGALYLGSELVARRMPLQGWLRRFPTNVEYPLSLLIAFTYLRFIEDCTIRRGAPLALVGAVILYLRPYVAIPWAMAVGLGMLWLLYERRLSVRVLLLTVGVLLLSLVPWFLVRHYNSALPVHREMLLRYFRQVPYGVHYHWRLLLGMAVAILALTWWLPRQWRVLTLSCGAALAALPFVCGLTSFAAELLPYDRFGGFYLTVLLAAGLVLLRERLRCGGTAVDFAHVNAWRWRLTAAALVCAGALGFVNGTYELMKLPFSGYPTMKADLTAVPAYTWVRANTPPDSLFLVDEGYDWAQAPTDPAALGERLYDLLYNHDDLFPSVAQRRRVYSSRLYGNALSDAQMQDLGMLQAGTFGFPIERNAYIAALKRYQPGYILWRKRAPVPRGYGAVLKALSTVVYSDDVCEVWKLQYTAEGQR